MYFEEFKLGMKAKLEPAIINKNDLIDFAKKYDNIPLHTNEEYAKQGIMKCQSLLNAMKKTVWSN